MRIPLFFTAVLLAAAMVQAARTAEPPVTAVAFAPDGETVVVGSQAGLEIRSWPDLSRTDWQSVPQSRIKTLETKLAHIHDLKFSPDGRFLAATGGEPAVEGTLEVFSWPGGERVSRSVLHEDLIFAIAWHPDGEALATAGLDHKTALVSDPRDFPKSRGSHRYLQGHSRGVKACCFLPDGKTLVTAGIDNSLRVWDASNGEVLRVLENHTEPVHDMALRPAQEEGTLPMLATVSEDRTIRLWQPTIGRMVRFTRLETAVPLAAAWTTDGSKIVACCSDGHLRLVDPDTVQILHDIPAVDGWAYSLAVHPAGREVVVGGQAGQLKRIALPAAAP